MASREWIAVNSKMDIMWKEAIRADTFLRELRKTMNNITQDSRCTSQDSNREPAQYKPDGLPCELPCSVP
jgi:hypothetical protein